MAGSIPKVGDVVLVELPPSPETGKRRYRPCMVTRIYPSDESPEAKIDGTVFLSLSQDEDLGGTSMWREGLPRGTGAKAWEWRVRE